MAFCTRSCFIIAQGTEADFRPGFPPTFSNDYRLCATGRLLHSGTLHPILVSLELRHRRQRRARRYVHPPTRQIPRGHRPLVGIQHVLVTASNASSILHRPPDQDITEAIYARKASIRQKILRSNVCRGHLSPI